MSQIVFGTETLWEYTSKINQNLVDFRFWLLRKKTNELINVVMLIEPNLLDDVVLLAISQINSIASKPECLSIESNTISTSTICIIVCKLSYKNVMNVF